MTVLLFRDSRPCEDLQCFNLLLWNHAEVRQAPVELFPSSEHYVIHYCLSSPLHQKPERPHAPTADNDQELLISPSTCPVPSCASSCGQGHCPSYLIKSLLCFFCPSLFVIQLMFNFLYSRQQKQRRTHGPSHKKML